MGFIKKKNITENTAVNKVLKIVEITTERRTPFSSPAPKRCAVITANPLFSPTTANIIKKNNGATAPTAARALTPRVLPTITMSARF